MRLDVLVELRAEAIYCLAVRDYRKWLATTCAVGITRKAT
jgi:hypothetical protein